MKKTEVGPVSVAFIALILACGAPIVRAQVYTAVALPGLNGYGGIVAGMNSSGTVVGNIYGGDAFSYSNGTITDLGMLGGLEVFANAINDSGTIVGYVYQGNTQESAFSISNGVTTNLNAGGAGAFRAYAINDSGTIVGESFVDSGGTIAALTSLGGGQSVAYGINASGTIVGQSYTSGGLQHAFSYGNGVMTDLGTLGGSTSSANAINGAGTIVGMADLSGIFFHAFSWSSGVMTDMGTLGGYTSRANAINSAGSIVGSSDEGAGSHAFLCIGGTMVDLNSLVNLPSVVLMYASAINDNGQVAAGGNVGNYYYSYLLTPTAGVGTHFIVSSPENALQGIPFNFKVIALDSHNNLASGYSGTVRVTSSDPAATLPANATLTNGVGAFSVTMHSTGPQTVTAADTGNAAIAGTSAPIALPTYFNITLFGPSISGGTESVTVTVVDNNGNMVTGYTGTLHFTSSDSAAVLPADTTMAFNSESFPVTLETPGLQTVTVTDTAISSLKGTSNTLNVSGPVTHFSISVSALTTGNVVGVAVTPLDASGNFAWSYTGSIHITSSDPAAVLPSNGSPQYGAAGFSVVLKTPGSQTITATDTINSALTATSSPVVVPGQVTHLLVTAPASAITGNLISPSVFVTALDALGNQVILDTDTIHLSSNGQVTVLGGDQALSGGSTYFNVFFVTPGTVTFSATDTSNSSISGVSNPTVVTGPFVRLGVSAPATTTAGSPINVTLTELDAAGNTVTSGQDIISITTSDPAALLPINVVTSNGVGTFQVTLNTAGSQTIAAADSVTPSISGVSAPIMVIAALGPIFTGQPKSQTVASGTSVTFSATVGGAATYQWSYNGTAIPGATEASYAIASVQASNSGDYTVTATNSSGAATTQPAFLIVTSTGGPTISTQPQSFTIVAGQTVVLTVAASSGQATSNFATRAQGLTAPASYQWYFNGAAIKDGGGIIGSQTAVLDLGGGTAVAGSYACVVTNSAGAVLSQPAVLSFIGPSSVGRLINVSCRAQVGTGGSQLIAGFVVGGAGTSGSETILARASGPALVPFGVSGTLPDPTLQLFNTTSGSGLIASNSGWGGSPAISAAATQTGAFAWAVPSSSDSALLEVLAPGPYTANISGKSGDTGVALAEIFDDTPDPSYTPASPRLINVSSRVQVGTGGNVLIAGFVLGGSAARTVLIRASGPALVPFGVSGTLPDPELQLFSTTSGGALLATNTGWGGNAQISSTASAVGAFSWGSSATNDSAILVTLPPGPYTANVSGANGDTGVALVEIYEVP